MSLFLSHFLSCRPRPLPGAQAQLATAQRAVVSKEARLKEARDRLAAVAEREAAQVRRVSVW